MKKTLLCITATILTLVLTNCDSSSNDCGSPEFLTRSELPEAAEDESYSTEIVAGVTNESHDDRFDYIFELESPLPDGLQLETFGFSRRAYIRGTPTQEGEYDIILSVEVTDISHTLNLTPTSQTESLCGLKHKQRFTISIQPE